MGCDGSHKLTPAYYIIFLTANSGESENKSYELEILTNGVILRYFVYELYIQYGALMANPIKILHFVIQIVNISYVGAERCKKQFQDWSPPVRSFWVRSCEKRGGQNQSLTVDRKILETSLRKFITTSTITISRVSDNYFDGR